MITPIISSNNTNKFCFRRFLIACIATTLILTAITVKANEDSTKQVAVSRELENRIDIVIKQNNLPELAKILDQGVNADGHTVLNCLLLSESQEPKLHQGLAALEMRYSRARSTSQEQSIN